MIAKSVKWALASLVIALPSAAYAVGLGDVRLLSSLNAPLDAEIDLVGATPEEMAVIKAQLASRDLFARNGLEWPNVGNVTITAQTKPDGKAVLRMRSSQAVVDPFLTLLVEVDALRTHTVREYTLLLDPPVFAPGEQQNAPVAAPSTGAGTREGAIARQGAPAPAQRPAEPAPSMGAPSRPSPSSGSSASEGGERTVRPGDTLSGIATEVANDSSQTRAWMLAIFQNNPSAFDNNMNVLRSGAVLRIPNASAVAAIVPSEANAEIRRQYASWRGSAAPAPSDSEPGRLRLVPPGAPGGAATPGDTQANTALQGRVRELESQLQESRRLLEARNAELAQLQARLSNQPAAAPSAANTPPPAAAEPPPPAPSAEATPPAGEATPPAAEATPPAAEQPPVAQETPPAAQEATPAPPVQSAEPAAADEGGGILGLLKDYWGALVALLAIIIALFGIKAFRARKQNDFDDSLSRLQGAAAGADALERDSTGDTQPLRAAQSRGDRESAFVVEESGTHERPRFSGGNDFSSSAAPRNVASDETISSETAINLDQGDPLAEADFHMAYGLYDQAADLVRIAISREPDRRDLKLKLLEVFFVWGNKDQFLQTAHELAETRERAAPGEWEKIVIMGKQLAPEDSLFAGSSGGGAGMGMDLDLEGGADRVDFDILGEPQVADGIDLDIGSALGEPGTDGSAATVTDANLALHEDGFTADDAGTGITREMTQNLRGDNSPTVQQFGADFEAPTVEQPGLYGGNANPTIKQKVESAMKHGGIAAEQTAELAIDDLGLDLGALEDSPNLNSTQEAPTLVAGLDERSRRIMDEAGRRGGMRDVDATAIASTGAWNLNGEDLEQPHDIPEYSNGSETSRLRALKGGGEGELDFNFNEEEPAAPAVARGGYTNGSGAAPDIDLDVGTATVPDTAFTATQKLSSEDLALPDLEPVTMSEVGTKLDLARAYMDMGDPEGARNILEEVMTEGSLAQKQEAQRLIESLPG